MSPTKKRGALVALCIPLFLAGLTVTAPSGADSFPPDPSGNIQLIGTEPADCSTTPADQTCESYMLTNLNNARAELHLSPYQTPADFFSLPPGEQLLILINEDRVAYGLQPVAGLNSTIDAAAQSGMVSDTDPPQASGLGNYSWAPNVGWGPAYPDVLFVYFDWMYADGLGGRNLACTQTDMSGCWGHRHDNLSFGSSATNSMGTAVGTDNQGRPAYATEIMETPSNPPYEYTWQQAVADGAGPAGPVTTTTTSTTSTSSGGGGGGGGGGGAPPNLNVFIAGPPSFSVGQQVTLTVFIGNSGVTTPGTLTVNTSGLSNVSATPNPYGFGNGCNAQGTTVSCDLGNLTAAPSGTSGHAVAVISGTTSAQTVTATANVTDPGETDPNDNTFSITLNGSSSSVTTPMTMPTTTTFKPPTVKTYKLAVVITPKNVGMVTGNSCTKGCKYQSPHTLKASVTKAGAKKGYVFSKWMGPCTSHQPTCTVKTNKPLKTVTAVFAVAKEQKK